MANEFRFDSKGNLITHQYDDKYFYVPMASVKMVIDNWKAGKRWFECSPLHNVTREEIAFIVTHENDWLLAILKGGAK